MRFLVPVAAIALSLAATPISAQRVDNKVQVAESAALAPLTVASAALSLAPPDAPRPWAPPLQKGMGGGVSGGRIVAIAIGAIIGGGLVYLGVSSMDCRDCDGSAATYGAIGGAVVGGFIGSAVYSFRQRRAVTPPASIGT
jgi:hypothetical protein